MIRHMRATALAIICAGIAGCGATTATLQKAPAAAPAQAPAPPPAPLVVAQATEAPPFPLTYDTDQLPKALTSEQATYRPGPEPGSNWPDLEAPKLPASRPDDINQALQQLAARLDAGEKPEAAGDEATFVATMGDQSHIYNLGPELPGYAVTDQLLYAFRRGDRGWTATRLCQYRAEWFGLYRLPTGEPLLFCGIMTGNGRMHRYVSIYRGTAEILRLDRLPIDKGSFVMTDAGQDGFPRLRIVHYNDWFGGGRLTDWIMERVTLTWDGGQYIATDKEWEENWAYHFARFDAFLGAGETQKASGELAFTPAGGLQAFIDSHAPDLRQSSHNWRPRWYPEERRLYVNTAAGDATRAPWYRFDFTPDGLIAGIGKQSDPPPER